MSWTISVGTIIFLSGSFALVCKKELTRDNKQFIIENCEKLKLNEIQFPEVKKFNAGGKNNTFIKLEKNGFQKFNELIQLFLMDCKILEVAEGAFDGLSKLSVLKTCQTTESKNYIEILLHR
jgi:hypothetical protein